MAEPTPTVEPAIEPVQPTVITPTVEVKQPADASIAKTLEALNSITENGVAGSVDITPAPPDETSSKESEEGEEESEDVAITANGIIEYSDKVNKDDTAIQLKAQNLKIDYLQKKIENDAISDKDPTAVKQKLASDYSAKYGIKLTNILIEEKVPQLLIDRLENNIINYDQFLAAIEPYVSVKEPVVVNKPKAKKKKSTASLSKVSGTSKRPKADNLTMNQFIKELTF